MKTKYLDILLAIGVVGAEEEGQALLEYCTQQMSEACNNNAQANKVGLILSRIVNVLITK